MDGGCGRTVFVPSVVGAGFAGGTEFVLPGVLELACVPQAPWLGHTCSIAQVSRGHEVCRSNTKVSCRREVCLCMAPLAAVLLQ